MVNVNLADDGTYGLKNMRKDRIRETLLSGLSPGEVLIDSCKDASFRGHYWSKNELPRWRLWKK